MPKNWAPLQVECAPRANCENRIKELKYDFAADSFNRQDFWTTEAAPNTVMLAYNLMSLLRPVMLKISAASTLLNPYNTRCKRYATSVLQNPPISLPKTANRSCIWPWPCSNAPGCKACGMPLKPSTCPLNLHRFTHLEYSLMENLGLA